MKFAITAGDEKTESRDFGHASCYLVFTSEPGRIATNERHKKPYHHHSTLAARHEHTHGHTNPTPAHPCQIGIASAIQDCERLISAGMGRDAYLSLECPGIKPTFTENLAITVVVNTCLDGSLQNQLNKLY